VNKLKIFYWFQRGPTFQDKCDLNKTFLAKV
jgi:hypothetical protein